MNVSQLSSAAPTEMSFLRKSLCRPVTDLLTIADGARHSGSVIDAQIVKALANERRLEIMNWLKDPRSHFPPQVEGDLVKDGVCGLFIADKLGVSQPTASEHLRILTAAGLIRAKRIKQWTFYRRDEKRIAEVKRDFGRA